MTFWNVAMQRRDPKGNAVKDSCSEKTGQFNNRGRKSRFYSAPPPSEPYVRFSRIRLSGQSGPARD